MPLFLIPTDLQKKEVDLYTGTSVVGPVTWTPAYGSTIVGSADMDVGLATCHVPCSFTWFERLWILAHTE